MMKITLKSVRLKHLLMLCVIGSTIVGYGAEQSKSHPERPNVVFIIVDDSEAVEYGCYGGNSLTPSIDQIASDGVLFENGFCSSSVCTPSRYSCLTGQYASRAKSLKTRYHQPAEMPTYVRWNTYLEPHASNVASVLQEQGYHTAMVGKWHIGHTEDYHEKVALLDGDKLKTENQAVAAGDPNADRSMRGGQPYALEDPEVNRFLSERYELAVEDIRTHFGFDYVGSFYSGNLTDYSKEMVEYYHHNQDWMTQGAIEFLEDQKDAQEPFFLYYSSTLQHGPEPRSSVRSNRRITAKGLIDVAPTVQPDADSIYQRLSDAGLPEWKAPFVWFDDSVGAIIEQLKLMGEYENTIIFFFSDQQSWGKGSCMDGGVKTPLLVSWPAGVEAGQVNTDLISNIDFAPTILDACGVEAPQEMIIDGQSFLPQLQGGEPLERTAVFFELGHMRAVRTEHFKYIAIRDYSDEDWAKLSLENQQSQEYRRRFFQLADVWSRPLSYRINDDAVTRWRWDHAKYASDPDQLYDLRVDPSETMNLATNREYVQELKQMKTLLNDWLQTMPGPFAEFKK